MVPEAVSYDIDGLDPGVHVGLPGPRLTMIFTFGEPLVVADDPVSAPRSYRAMVAGLSGRPSYVLHNGCQAGVQLSLNPLSAAALVGMPVGELSDRIVDLHHVWSGTDRLLDRLQSATNTPALALALGEELHRRRRGVPGPASEVAVAWRLIQTSVGAVRIDEIADRVGWSRRHLTNRFGEWFGVTPKLAAQLHRFHRAQRQVVSGRHDLATVAAQNGYADQAHMSREFTRMAGNPPRRWLRQDSMAASVA
jgi:AraC-like DNA-binding protein